MIQSSPLFGKNPQINRDNRCELSDEKDVPFLASFLICFCPLESGLKTRMELTKIHAIAVLQELKAKSEEVYKDMDDWLGARFQQEMGR